MKSLYLINHYFSFPNVSYESQNSNYEGIFFYHQSHSYRSRLAKKTLRKNGYFVSFWKKDIYNKNQPYSFEEAPDNTLIWILDEHKKGFFNFPKDILLKKGILKSHTTKGKMGIRVYPVWETTLNSAATKTQSWQLDYFTLIK
ncbi:MepB family protein [Vagococcus sp. JNUCC 83]